MNKAFYMTDTNLFIVSITGKMLQSGKMFDYCNLYIDLPKLVGIAKKSHNLGYLTVWGSGNTSVLIWEAEKIL